MQLSPDAPTRLVAVPADCPQRTPVARGDTGIAEIAQLGLAQHVVADSAITTTSPPSLAAAPPSRSEP